jgi:hypothetical protein
MGASLDVLKKNKRLVVFPLLSSLAMILVMVSFALPFFNDSTMQSLKQADQLPPAYYAVVFAFYFVSYLVFIFFNAALVACVFADMRGEEATIGYGLSYALKRLPQILGWAALTGTVGFVLRLIEERVGLIGRIVVGLLGMAWTVTSFLVVPILVEEDKGPFEAYKQSVSMFKRTWGEQLIGNTSFGLVFIVLGILPAMLLLFGAAAVAPPTLVVLGPLLAIYMLVLMLVQSTLQTIFQVAIYKYAADGAAPAGFDGDLIAEAFRVKKGKK